MPPGIYQGSMLDGNGCATSNFCSSLFSQRFFSFTHLLHGQALFSN
jgi:hypothetical protein